VTHAAPGVKPYSALELAGRDIYVREGCYGCHSQMIRPLRAETERYGHYSVAGESVYDHEWHRVHLINPRDVVPESNMPAYQWLAGRKVDAAQLPIRLSALRTVGVPYTDEEIASAAASVEGKTEMDALIAYLQGLGLASKQWN
jgi:cytochrome c oxidase cbb3-type subunit II